MIYKRTDIEQMHCDVRRYRSRCQTIHGQVKLQCLIVTKGTSHVEHRRIYKAGNSWVLTLSAHLLNHMKVYPGDYIRIDTIGKHRIRLSRQRTRIKQPFATP